MQICDWIVGLFCLASGVGVAGFWAMRFASRRVDTGQQMIRLHLVAEFATASALIAAGIGTFVDARAGTTLVLVGVSLGLLVYASVQSPAFYPDEPPVRALLWVTLLGAILIFVYRLVTL
jgi:hypothetical protein